MRPGAALLLGCLLLAGCQGHDALVPGIAIDTNPFESQAPGRIETGTELDTVPVGEPVVLRWTAAGFTAFIWELRVPPGSSAQLSDPAATSPSFVPDLGGDYEVSVTAFNGAVSEASRRITAASYLGRAACAVCHPARASRTAASAHAMTAADLGATIFGTPGCLTCHVLNPVPPPATPVPGSFDDEAQRAGFDPATFTTFAALQSGFPEVADRASVQCESCHGPGSRHDSDPRRIAVSLRSEQCGTCHNGTVGPDRLGQWNNSAHGEAPPAAALADPSCVRCHSARGFLRAQAGVAPEAEQTGVPGTTCAVCHNSHAGPQVPAQLRVFGSVPLTSGGSFNAGRAAACITCHQSDVADPTARADAGALLPCAVQADMIASRGAVEFGLSFGSSFHGTTVFRLRSFTGDPEDSNTPDSCVICHMAVASGPLEDLLGGHAMAQREGTTSFVTGNCDRCHPGLTTFDFNLGKDFDGDGLRRGVQTEVRGLSEILYGAISRADIRGGVSRPQGALTPAFVDPDLSLTTPVLRRAVYNYNFVVTDRSWGVHNTVYAVQLLQRTYEQVTGVPFRTAFPRAQGP